MHDEAYAAVLGLKPPSAKRVYEIGSLDINGSVRSLFPDAQYHGMDRVAGRGVDGVGDGATYRPPFEPDCIVCCEVLEHATDPAAIVRQIGRVIAPGGVVIITCAGPDRRPHSAVDGAALREGESYANVQPHDLRGWLEDAGFTDVSVSCGPGAAGGSAPESPAADVYATARKRRVAVSAGMNLRILLLHPGASWSTADVYDGLLYGLQRHGVQVIPYRLDTRIEASGKALHALWRMKKKENPTLAKPHHGDVLYHAGVGALEMALRESVHVVLVVSAMFLHPDVIVMMKRAGLKVVVLFTESPYDEDHELRIAAMVDGCWTHERRSVEKFRAVNPRSGYLRHAYHPHKHFVSAREVADLPHHDVVFVGSGFPERVKWLNSIDWTGIDLGLYGTWVGLGLTDKLQACVRGGQVTNEMAASLYRRAKIGLNLYRSTKGYGRHAQRVLAADSLSPRAYELAACGVFHLSEYRAEVPETFGDLVPSFTFATEAAALIRLWLTDPDGRQRIAAQLPACVAEHSWTQRAATVIGDLHVLLNAASEGATHGQVSGTQGRDLHVHHGFGRRDECDQPESMDPQPRDRQDSRDVLRRPQQNLRPGPAGRPGHVLGVLG